MKKDRDGDSNYLKYELAHILHISAIIAIPWRGLAQLIFCTFKLIFLEF